MTVLCSACLYDAFASSHQLYPALLRWAAPTRAIQDRSMAIGCFAEIFDAMTVASAKYTPNFIALVTDIMRSSECPPLVLRNCVYALGVAVAYAPDATLAGKVPALIGLVQPHIALPDVSPLICSKCVYASPLKR